MGRVVVRNWAIATALAFLAESGVARAQRPAGTGMLFGVVRDSSGARVGNVEVQIVGALSAAVSNDSGAYRIAGLDAGTLRVRFRHLGYAPETTSVMLGAGERRELSFTLSRVVATELGAVVIADRLQGKMGPFNTRRARGVGTFITREQIEARHAVSLSELLRYVPGVGVQQRMAGEPQPVQMRRSVSSTIGGNCTVRLYVDGQRYENGNVDDFHPTSVEGIEVYRSASEIPADFRAADATCGIISIWTRDPEAARRRP
jgi:outer membrane receptor protein involved in Fe transport